MASLAGIPAQYNKKSSAVKRIMQEARELVREPSTDFAANPLEAYRGLPTHRAAEMVFDVKENKRTDIFEWHFTIRGPEETEFEGGLYHGRILLPNNYPFAPPSLMFLTPNGRFELNKKVCLSITGYHPEYWQPAWGIRTVLVAVMGFLPTQSKGAIGGLDTSVVARKALAVKSKTWVCETCHSDMVTILPDVAPGNVVKACLKADEMPPEFSFGYEADKKATEDDAQGSSNGTGGNRPSSQGANDKGSKSMDSSTTAPSSPNRTAASSPRTAVVSPGLAAAEARVLAAQTEDSSPATTIPSTTPLPVDLSKEQGSASATTSLPSPAAPTFRSAHYNPSQPQPTNSPTRPQQAQGQQQTQQIHRVNSSPIWLDVLIIGFGGVLVALVLKRLLM